MNARSGRTLAHRRYFISSSTSSWSVRTKENVSLYVFPFSAKPVFTMTCMYAYFEYQDPENLEQDLVQIETQAGFWTIDDPIRVADYRKAHDNLIESSLSEDDSRALIRSILDSLPA